MLAVCVTATPSTVADMVFDSATVELSVPVATPLAFVVALGCVSVLPVPVAERTTVAPAIGFPSASRAVTVIADWLLPLEAVIGDVADTPDCAPDTVLAWTTTVAVCVMATELMVADTVFVSATAELSVPVATPLWFVGPPGCVRVLPVPVAANTTVAPAIGLPNPSLAVTVMVEAPVPAAIGDVAVTVDSPADRAPVVTTTVAVCVTATPSIVADTVFDSATVELSVPVATPLAFVVAPGCVNVLSVPVATPVALVVALGCVSVLPLPVAASTTVAPATGLPDASRAVTVIVDWLLPLEAVIGDVAAMPDCVPETLLAWTTTVAVWVMSTALTVADTVFDSATVELKLPVATPLAPVVALGWVSVLPDPVALSTTVAPAIGLSN